MRLMQRETLRKIHKFKVGADFRILIVGDGQEDLVRHSFAIGIGASAGARQRKIFDFHDAPHPKTPSPALPCTVAIRGNFIAETGSPPDTAKGLTSFEGHRSRRQPVLGVSLAFPGFTCVVTRIYGEIMACRMSNIGWRESAVSLSGAECLIEF